MREIILISIGGIGDAIVCTPTIKALRKKNPKKKIVMYCQREFHYDVFKNNPNIDSLRNLKFSNLILHPLHLFAYVFNRKMVEYTLLDFHHIDLFDQIYKQNVKTIVTQLFNFPLSVEDCEIYLTEDENIRAKKVLSTYKTPIILHTKSASSDNNNWEHARWEELVSSLPQYSFIQVGVGDEPYVKGSVDLRGKTPLRDVFALIKNAVSFVGVASGFSHVTNAFGKKGVVVFGATTPAIWGHHNNINIWGQVPCSPCFGYLWEHKCPYDKECMKQVTVEQVRSALIEQIQRNLAADNALLN